MSNVKQILAISSFALFYAAAPTTHAMTPVCHSASSDSDGDGWGWENHRSCLVGATTTTRAILSSGASSNSNPTSDSRFPVCASSSSDPDGDGYGWENSDTCVVTSDTSEEVTDTVLFNSPIAGDERPSCVSALSDPDGDGYGWENNDTCLVTASTGLISDDAADSDSVITDSDTADTGPVDSGPIDSGAADTATADTTAADTTVPDTDVADTVAVDTGAADNTNTSDNNDGSFSSGDGGAVTRVTSLPVVTSTSVTTTADSGDLFATEQVGDFLLNQNAWRSSRAAPGYDWSQTIKTNTNGVPVSWTYDWGPGIPGASGRPSDDYYVRSYPELIFGIKDEFRTSAPKSQIGFPVRVDEMANVQIDFSFNAPEFGTARTVQASVNSRFPNGSVISGERNVAVESFLYEPTNGVCDDSLEVNRTNGSNHVYEVMVWLDSGAERLPASSRDFVTTISLRGASYNVFTKSDDTRYIAFVAQDPVTSGTIYWNDYLDWARQNAHQVEALFGANINSEQIQDSWCVANIIVGTEIFWGAGDFDLFDWSITQRQ